MNISVIGGRGREHALIWALAKSPHTKRLWCLPGNGGTANEKILSSGRVENVPIPPYDIDRLVAWSKNCWPDLTVVGPEIPLALGLVDKLTALGLRVFGPNQRGALFESSKAFAHNFNGRWNIPQPVGEVFDSPRQARMYAAALFSANRQCVVKADGLCNGKGVEVCETLASARDAIKYMMVENRFGPAGHRVVIQDRLIGNEQSLHVLTDGKTFRAFPTSKDYKRLGDGDTGPNTGGMGAYSHGGPSNIPVQADLLNDWSKGCREEEITYRGLLYPGLMLKKGSLGIKGDVHVLEFNCRFGDPETEAYLPRLETDIVEILLATVDGRLDDVSLKWSSDACVCVVLADREYPKSNTPGLLIEGIEEAERLPGVKVFHAGTVAEDSHSKPSFFTHGGRVLAVTGKGRNLAEAREVAYAGVERVSFRGRRYRRDIAKKV